MVGRTTQAEAATALQNSATLWSVLGASGHDVVRAACDALVAGLDSPALRELAGLTRSETREGVPALLPSALRELGLSHHARGSVLGEDAAVRLLSADLLAGAITPRDLTDLVSRYCSLSPLATRLLPCEYDYELGEVYEEPPERTDTKVIREARRLVSEA